MPLSEHEQKLLEQMERALYAEDPKFATQMKGSRDHRAVRNRIAIGVLVAVVGLGLIVAGVSNGLVWLGGIGFAVMVGGVAWAATPPRRPRESDSSGTVTAMPGRGARRSGRAARRGQPARGSFIQRMENRWEERRRSEGR